MNISTSTKNQKVRTQKGTSTKDINQITTQMIYNESGYKDGIIKTKELITHIIQKLER